MSIFPTYSISHGTLFLFDLCLIIWAIKLWIQRKSIAMFVTVFVVASMAFDNATLALGHWFGESSLLLFLNQIRFLLHYLIVPLLIFIGVELANLVGAGWAIPLTRIFSLITAFSVAAWDIYHRFWGHQLIPVNFADTIRYTLFPISGPPISTIAINLFILLIGVGVWVRLEGTWPWLFWAAIASFIGNAIPVSVVGTLPGSFVEFLLAFSLISTESYAQNTAPSLGIDQNIEFKFLYLEGNWVAIHPEPIGVINFIGGAFFGTFPTLFYRYCLRRLYQEGYTIIAYPFKNRFNHWKIAIQFAKQFARVRSEIVNRAVRINQEIGTEKYKNLTLYTDPQQWISGSYFWLGHSVGCKYIALLEVLSNPQAPGQVREPVAQLLKKFISEEEAQDVAAQLEGIDITTISLRNQASILMAPVITGIESAIPFRFLANLIKKLKIDFKPNEEVTKKIILGVGLFHFMTIIGFKGDQIVEKAGTIKWLEGLQTRPQFLDDLDQEIDQKDLVLPKFLRNLLRVEHLAPLNVFRRNEILANHLIDLLPKLRHLVQSK